MNTVAAPRQQLEAGPRAGFVFGFRQDAPAARDHGVGRQDVSVGMTGDHSSRFFHRKAHGMSRRQFPGARGFVDAGGVD
jgi:hypothetical protein